MNDKILPSFPQRGQLEQLQILELSDADVPPNVASWVAKLRFTQQMVRWFSLMRVAIVTASDEPQLPQSRSDSPDNQILEQQTGPLHGENDDVFKYHVPPMSGKTPDWQILLTMYPEKFIDTVMTELLSMFPPAQRNWVDFTMRQAGGIIKLEGDTAAFPGFVRSGVDTRSTLADGSALTGHEVLDEAYSATNWNGKIETPTKNAVRDVLEDLKATRIPSALPVPVAEGGTGSANAAGARANLGAAAAGAAGVHTITLAKLTGGGANGSITWNADGVVTAYTDPT